jgi:SAM-dependent methyltransferase
MIQNPKTFWNGIAKQPDWKSYILPRENDADFNAEGLAEAQRLFYFFDGKSTVVDYGCGIGRVTQYIAERAGYVVGIDICQDFLHMAGALIRRNNVAFFQADEYPRENVADLVYCLMVMQHNDAENRLKIMSHIHRLLINSGVAVVSFPRVESSYYQEGPFVHKFTRKEVMVLALPFRYCWITEGNLPGYNGKPDGDNEYFLTAIK